LLNGRFGEDTIILKVYKWAHCTQLYSSSHWPLDL
jgi:hypothetical protein